MKAQKIGAVALMAAIAIGFMLVAQPINQERPLERSDNFSYLDYDAFDRNFQINAETCKVGLAAQRLCFSQSPLQTQIAKGERLERHIPVMAAEISILVATPPKAEHQKLLRYGTKLVLLNENTQVIEDIIELGPKQA